MTPKWTPADIPDQRGRIAVVTVANSGIGFFAARELARAGAPAVLACIGLARPNLTRDSWASPPDENHP